MGKPSEESIARENALVESASKLYPVLELECEGKRAIMLGGHEYDIDSISVSADERTMLISEWVLEHCLRLPDGGGLLSAAAAHQLTLTKACVVSYGGKDVPKMPLLEWCQDMCNTTGIATLKSGSRLLVYWWDQMHSQQAGRPMAQGHTWWPSTYNPQHAQFGVWFSARVQWYDKKQAALHVIYEYNESDEPEYGKLILPLNYVHFGDTPPAYGTHAQVFPPPWEAAQYETPAKEPTKEDIQVHKPSGLFLKNNVASSSVTTVTAATAHGSGKWLPAAELTGGSKGKRGYGHEPTAVTRNVDGPPRKKAALQERPLQPLPMPSNGLPPTSLRNPSAQATKEQARQQRSSSGAQDKSVGDVGTMKAGSLCCKLIELDQGCYKGLQESQLLGGETAQQQASRNSPVSRQGQQSLGQAHPVNVSGEHVTTAVISTGRGSKDGTIISESNHDQATNLLHSHEGLRPMLSTEVQAAGPARSNPATGPSRRVCWPGATTQQIMKLVSMPAVYPLHGPICEEHVRSLKTELAARSPGKHMQQVLSEGVAMGQVELSGAQHSTPGAPSLAACITLTCDILGGLSHVLQPILHRK